MCLNEQICSRPNCPSLIHGGQSSHNTFRLSIIWYRSRRRQSRRCQGLDTNALAQPNYEQSDYIYIVYTQEYLLQYAKPAEWMYPETVYTDQKPEQVICDAVKARILDHLPNEVPYKCKVKLELYNKLRDGRCSLAVSVLSFFYFQFNRNIIV